MISTPSPISSPPARGANLCFKALEPGGERWKLPCQPFIIKKDVPKQRADVTATGIQLIFSKGRKHPFEDINAPALRIWFLMGALIRTALPQAQWSVSGITLIQSSPLSFSRSSRSTGTTLDWEERERISRVGSSSWHWSGKDPGGTLPPKKV
ncbi:hypothetical protein AV530_009647 [Patagioenas fasciata monilis]|uniref:Uncharacterized protein n=1 Tax=Patagioenas fasciata monilis TaxID=372326 RepID=A0A1V4JGK3_PATFA|nr:hypothetical protein AV530_009647 [Patagioenas fasciata monilis]